MLMERWLDLIGLPHLSHPSMFNSWKHLAFYEPNEESQWMSECSMWRWTGALFNLRSVFFVAFWIECNLVERKIVISYLAAELRNSQIHLMMSIYVNKSVNRTFCLCLPEKTVIWIICLDGGKKRAQFSIGMPSVLMFSGNCLLLRWSCV